MSTVIRLLITVFFLIMNIIAFALYAIDKRNARKGARRIPERTLLLVSAFGGAVGALIGMYRLRHKTKHARFVILVPVFLVINLVALLFTWIL